MIFEEPAPVELPTRSGPMRVHRFEPVTETADAKFPALILYSEIFQVTGPIRRIAARLAGRGYLVAVPEIFHELEPPGRVLAYDKAGTDAGNAHKIEKELASYDDDTRATLAFLSEHPRSNGKIGAIGVCIGGHLAFRAALFPEVRAAACFYATDLHKRSLGLGQRDDSLQRAAEIRGELLMVWGRQDPHVPREGRRLVHDALDDAGVRFSWLEVNAQHAFLRDEGPRYDPALAEHAYALAFDLFARRLT
jgi:carboxymethylenebutenolidase